MEKFKKNVTKKDTYQIWTESGKLNEILDFIKECARKLVTQKEMCKHLGITQDTFSRLKRKYPDIAKMQFAAKINLKMDLMGALYKRAVGYEFTDEVQHIEDSGKGKPPKRKIVKTTKHVPADKYSAVYLLTKHFGREFSDKSYELHLLEKRMLNNKEEWLTDVKDTEV